MNGQSAMFDEPIGLRPDQVAERPEPDPYPEQLYDGRPPAEHTPTSRAAGDSVRMEANTIRAHVKALILAAGEYGITDEELQACGIAANTERPRRRELVLLGEIVDSGRTRRTASGRAAVVWVVKS